MTPLNNLFSNQIRLENEKKALQQKIGVDVNKKLRVCDVCGSFLSIFDSDKYELILTNITLHVYIIFKKKSFSLCFVL